MSRDRDGPPEFLTGLRRFRLIIWPFPQFYIPGACCDQTVVLSESEIYRMPDCALLGVPMECDRAQWMVHGQCVDVHGSGEYSGRSH
jgi:hypothetical protein